MEARTPVTERTRFRIASVSKVLTAAAVGRLHEQGLLDLDSPAAITFHGGLTSSRIEASLDRRQ